MPTLTNPHQYHFSPRLGCKPCSEIVDARWLQHQIAQDPKNYNPKTRLFIRPVGFQFGHNQAVIQGTK